MRRELDFVTEARNSERLAQNFAHRHEDITAPRVVWERSTPRVLTMEWQSGCKVRRIRLFSLLGQSFLTACRQHPLTSLLIFRTPGYAGG